jgi:hypothetical protein
MKSLAVSDVHEFDVEPKNFVQQLSQEEWQQLRGDTICARCGCELRTHVWMVGGGIVGECRLHGSACEKMVIDEDFESLKRSQPEG